MPTGIYTRTPEMRSNISNGLKKRFASTPKIRRETEGFQIGHEVFGGVATRFKKGQIAWNKIANKKTSIASLLRGSYSNKFKKEAYERYGRKCKKCGDDNKLEIHHIVPLGALLKKNAISTVEEGIKCDELWNLNNIEILCRECHKLTTTYGSKSRGYVV